MLSVNMFGKEVSDASMNVQIFRVNMQTLTVEYEERCKTEATLAGRSLTAHRLSRELQPNSYPVGPRNRLFLLPGVLGGTAARCSGRLSAGGKSPPIGGAKESKAGGVGGHKLARLGTEPFVFDGMPECRDAPYLLFLGNGSCEPIPCPELRGLRVYEPAQRLRDRHGKKLGVILIGPQERCGLQRPGSLAPILMGNQADIMVGATLVS